MVCDVLAPPLQLFAMVTMVVSEITPSAGCTVMGIALHLTILAQFSIMAVIVSAKAFDILHGQFPRSVHCVWG